MSRAPEPLSIGRVIGEVVDNFIPCVRLIVTYNSNKQVSNGHELMPSVIMAKPRVDIGGDDLRAAYTLVSPIVCIAALTRREIVSYETPKPVIGIHRYVFVLFKQRARHSVRPPPSRDYFNTRNFAEENGLGLPVAAVYFNAQRETACRRR
ncbi:hypothetical protein DH2020_034127 [Rehmannia glutinosa]|uniref:Uncharacterized protein n=1 Tax=Rehmannia glutinosa TaxID=99300 RepID=A0ABR0VCT9_REHGL